MILAPAPEGAGEETPAESTDTPAASDGETEPKDNTLWVIAGVGAGAVVIGAGTAVAIKKKKSK